MLNFFTSLFSTGAASRKMSYPFKPGDGYWDAKLSPSACGNYAYSEEHLAYARNRCAPGRARQGN